MDETLLGAANRAKAATLTQPPPHFGVGIENGIVQAGGKVLDLAVVVVIDVVSGRLTTASSVGVEIPADAVDAARLQGFGTTTAGAVLARTYPNMDPKDPHATLMGGKFDRTRLLTDAVAAAAAQQAFRA